MPKPFGLLIVIALPVSLLLSGPVGGEQHEVKITRALDKVEVSHQGAPVTITRNQQKEHTVNPAYSKTSRPCPPFCIQPGKAAPGVETIGELEMLEYLKQASEKDSSVLVVDSRTPDWLVRGTIPGSVNIPWTRINKDSVPAWELEAADTVTEVLTQNFGAEQTAKGWDFANAKALVLFCNGIWCPQSNTNIQTLLKLGYPPEKLKWYRGGMQSWESVGLTTIKP